MKHALRNARGGALLLAIIKSLSLAFFLLLSSVLILAPSLFAQTVNNGQALAVNLEIADSDVQEGDIISVTKEGYKKAAQAYDALIFGVVVDSPILSVKEKNDSTKPVVSSGEAIVRVSTANGEIKEGDLITSSGTPGVGQKATQGGYIVGKALAPYSDSTKAGLVPTIVNIGYSAASGSGAGLFSLVGVITNPENLRYTLAAIVGILFLIAISIAFIRLISSGVTAIGRNPLAKGTIVRGMVIAGVIIAILAIAGAGAIVAIINLGK